MKRIALLLCTISCAAAVQAQNAALTVPSIPMRTFQDSIGINGHPNYTDGMYADETQTLANMQYVGIRHMRANIPYPAGWPPGALANQDALAASGIVFDLVADCNTPVAEQMQQLDAFAQVQAGDIATIEGTNEINNQPCTAGSGSNEQNAEAFQTALYAAVKADPLLKSIPVLYFTGGATQSNLAGMADATNTHPYPYNEEQPWARLQSDFQSYFAGSASSAPQYITETGYFDIPSQGSGVDEAGQGQMGLNAWFDSALQGVQRNYEYQLLQAYTNVATNSDTAYGIFHYDGSPTILAQMLHNLSQAFPLDAKSAVVNAGVTLTSGSGAPLPATVHALALTTSTGDVVVWVWNEAPVWNASTQSSTMASPITVQVQLPGKWSTVQAAWPLSNTPYNWPYAEISQGQETTELPVVSFPTSVIFRK